MGAKVSRAALALVLCLGVGALAACAPAASGSPEPEADAAAPEGTTAAGDFSWSADADCATCHSAAVESGANEACGYSQHAEMPCMTCHDDEAGLAAAHEGVAASDKVATKLKETVVKDEPCLSCHGGSLESLVAATPDAVVMDSKGTEANPHEVLQQEQHGEIACADCHQMHDDKPIETAAHDECLSCHHTDVFTCYTCHE